MFSSLTRIPALLAACAWLALSSGLGCTEERKPINKVQANALAKRFFVGDPGNPNDDPAFYFRTFDVDASESQDMIGIGAWGGVDRVKWEISENMLFARRAYGQGEGADDKGTGKGFPDGTIVAAYPIVTHFDIKRAYNPQTGEELNVIEENTTDRPWYQRDHFRVDWSTNQVDTPQWADLFIGKLTGEIKVTPISYYVSDPNHDDAPHFDTEDGYFDVTSKFLIEPKESAIPGLPQCYLIGIYTGTAAWNCDPQEAVVRSSYWRVDKLDADGDFEPFENTRAELDIIGNPGGLGDSGSAGIVTPPRLEWDPGYGYVDAGMKRFMHVHNVWQQSHQTRGECETDGECRTLVGAGASCLPSGACSVPCNYSLRGDRGGGAEGTPNGTDDQCENGRTGYNGSAGSQCSARNRCTIPYRDRKVQPIAWWVNADMPTALQDELDSSGKVTRQGPTEDLVYTWNQAISLGIAHAREAECRRTQSGPNVDAAALRADCHQRYFEVGPDGRTAIEMVSYGGWGIDKVKDRVDAAVTCHNPVRSYDPDACGEENTRARVGDLRRNFVFYWPYSSRAPWGGIANWNADPLTGQIIGAAATTMGRSATMSAAQIRDILLVSAGELDIADITGGVSAQLFQQRLRNGEPRFAIPLDEVNRRVAAIDVKGSREAFGFDLTGPSERDRLIEAAHLKSRTTSDPAVLSTVMAEFAARAKPLAGSQLEAKLIDSSWLVDAAGLDPTTPLSDQVLAQVSPFQGRDSGRVTQAMRAMSERLAARGVCVFAPGEGVGNPDIRGLARYFTDPEFGLYRDGEVIRIFDRGEKGPPLTPAEIKAHRAELIYEHLWKETYKGITLHEIGHALGMLHNYASSYDAMNFDPQYWQLRTNEGQTSASCEGVPRDGGEDTCMGPRFLDPETADELGQDSEPRPGINYFGHTTTMEYQNERFFETIGLGQFDVMTMGALYGRVLETFDPGPADGVPAGEQRRFSWLSFSQLIESNLVDDNGPRPMHYTELGRQVKVFDPARCRDATDEERSRAEWRVVHGKVCAPPPKDHAPWHDFVDGDLATDLAVPKGFDSPDVAGGTGNVRWPYRWGVSENGYAHINPFDSGADAYETTRETIRKFDYSYPFYYFRRQRRDWEYESSVPSYTASRFLERLQAYHWVYSRNQALSSLSTDDELPTNDVDRSERLAEIDMFNAIARAILMPQPGAFGRNATLQRGTVLFDATTNEQVSFSLDASVARFIEPDYDGGPAAGGSWDYWNWINHTGYHFEKVDAARALTDGRPPLTTISRDTFLDGRRLYINFRTDMSTAVDRLMAGLLAGDWSSIAPHVVDPNNPIPEYLDLTQAVPTRPADVAILYPNLGYKQQVGAAIWARLFSGLGNDLGLANKMDLALESTAGSEVQGTKVRFYDPRNNLYYAARRYGTEVIDGRTVETGIAARMLARANELFALYYDVIRDAAGNPVLDPGDGRPQLALPAGTSEPVVIGSASVGQQFADYVDLLDTMVTISYVIDPIRSRPFEQ